VMAGYVFSGLAWMTAYGLFVAVYLPFLVRPRMGG